MRGGGDAGLQERVQIASGLIDVELMRSKAQGGAPAGMPFRAFVKDRFSSLGHKVGMVVAALCASFALGVSLGFAEHALLVSWGAVGIDFQAEKACVAPAGELAATSRIKKLWFDASIAVILAQFGVAIVMFDVSLRYVRLIYHAICTGGLSLLLFASLFTFIRPKDYSSPAALVGYPACSNFGFCFFSEVSYITFRKFTCKKPTLKRPRPMRVLLAALKALIIVLLGYLSAIYQLVAQQADSLFQDVFLVGFCFPCLLFLISRAQYKLAKRFQRGRDLHSVVAAVCFITQLCGNMPSFLVLYKLDGLGAFLLASASSFLTEICLNWLFIRHACKLLVKQKEREEKELATPERGGSEDQEEEEEEEEEEGVEKEQVLHAVQTVVPVTAILPINIAKPNIAAKIVQVRQSLSIEVELVATKILHEELGEKAALVNSTLIAVLVLPWHSDMLFKVILLFVLELFADEIKHWQACSRGIATIHARYRFSFWGWGVAIVYSVSISFCILNGHTLSCSFH